MQSIEWIAKIKTNAGYDIASYNSPDDKQINRFIEVKSYAGNNKYFYLSKNELKKSKSIGEEYWLYLVNRDNLNDKYYTPKMIQNPYLDVFTSDKWLKVAENWRFDEI